MEPATSMEPALSKPVLDILQARIPTTVTVFLRPQSPPVDFSTDEVVQQTCSTLGVSHHHESCKLLEMIEFPKRAVFVIVIEIFHDQHEHDASTADGPPVLRAEYANRQLSSITVASATFRRRVNVLVAKYHPYLGRQGKRPTAVKDQTGSGTADV